MPREWGRRLEVEPSGKVHAARSPRKVPLSKQPLAPPDPFDSALPPFLENDPDLRDGFLKVADFVKLKRREGLTPSEAYEAAARMVAHYPELEAVRQGRKVARIRKSFTAGLELALRHYHAYAEGV